MLPVKLSPFGINIKTLPYDREVEYLESTGTQWIDTGVPISTTFTIKGKFQIESVPLGAISPAGFWFKNGNSFGSPEYALSLYFRPSSNDFRGQAGNPNVPAILSVPLEGIHTFSITNGSVTLDSITLSTETRNLDALIQYSQHLFGIYIRNPYASEYGNSRNGNGLKIFNAIWELHNNTIRDFIPVRTTIEGKRVGAMYDRANPKGGPNGNGMYYNQGSGDFIIGPDI